MVRILALALGVLGSLALAAGLGAESPGQGRVAQAVPGPVPDGVSLEVPAILGNRAAAAQGLVDVTAAPFAADPTGRRDSTLAIQMAVDFARDRQMVCFFPSGTYRVSDTIECVQGLYRRTSGAVLGAREHPCVLLGARSGKRPVIVLAPNSRGFGDPRRPKRLIHFWARDPGDPRQPLPSISMNQSLVNLDIVIGPGNPGAVAIRHRAAQGSTIQECAIDATHGLTGIEGGIGSGGSLAGVTVLGGEIGLDLRETQPAPTIAAVTLVNQTRRAILYAGRQALSAVGVTIRSRTRGPVIETSMPRGYPHNGQMCLADSEIVFEGPAGEAIAAGASLYLDNVYVRGAADVVVGPGGERLPGNPGGWTHVREYALGVEPAPWKGHAYTTPVYFGGYVLPGAFLRLGKPEPPPADLTARHALAPDTPGPDTPDAANVKRPPYNAVGDGLADDTEALQKALDASRSVFLPKGYYRISRPLLLGPETRLAGVAGHLSLILARPGPGAFAAPGAPQPLVRTVDSPDTRTQLAFLGLFAPRETPAAFALDWRCGGDAELRAVNFPTFPPLEGYAQPGHPAPRDHPLVLARGSGGGRWINVFQEDSYSQGPSYRHVSLAGTAGPLRIYQCNPEHGRGQVNMDILDAHNVTIYGLKGEGNRPVLRIVNGTGIRVLGYGGNAAAFEGRALFEVEGCRDCVLANLVDSPRLSGEGSEESMAGRGVDPELWSMVQELAPGGVRRGAAPLARPVAYILP